MAMIKPGSRTGKNAMPAPEIVGFAREFEYKDGNRKKIVHGWINDLTLMKGVTTQLSREESEEKLVALYRKSQINKEEPNVAHYKAISSTMVGERFRQNIYTDGRIAYKVVPFDGGIGRATKFAEVAEVKDATWVIVEHYDFNDTTACFTKASEKEILQSIKDVVAAL